MSWKNYAYDIIQYCKVAITGWPDNIKFGDLSSVVTGLRQIKALCDSWKSGVTKFIRISDAEVEERFADHRRYYEAGEIAEDTPRQPHLEKGKKLSCNEHNDPGPSSTQKRNRVSSSEFIDSANDNNNDKI